MNQQKLAFSGHNGGGRRVDAEVQRAGRDDNLDPTRRSVQSRGPRTESRTCDLGTSASAVADARCHSRNTAASGPPAAAAGVNSSALASTDSEHGSSRLAGSATRCIGVGDSPKTLAGRGTSSTLINNGTCQTKVRWERAKRGEHTAPCRECQWQKAPTDIRGNLFNQNRPNSEHAGADRRAIRVGGDKEALEGEPTPREAQACPW